MTIQIGIELSATLTASNRARGNYLKSELARHGYETRYVAAHDRVPVRIMLERDPFRPFSPDEKRIFDVSDAILTPLRSSSFLTRAFRAYFPNRHWTRFLSRCDAVVAASKKQASMFSKFNNNVHVIPDSTIYDSAYSPVEKQDITKKLIFGWDGQAHNIRMLYRVIEKNFNFFRQPDILLRVITDKFDKDSGDCIEDSLRNYRANIEFIEWKEQTFKRDINACHIGLAPIDIRCKHSKAKPENKLANYSSLGLTTVCTRTPAYASFAKNVPEAITLCESDTDWARALIYWRDNKTTTLQKGLAARTYALKHYSPESLGRRWADLIFDLTRAGGHVEMLKRAVNPSKNTLPQTK